MSIHQRATLANGISVINLVTMASSRLNHDACMLASTQGETRMRWYPIILILLFLTACGMEFDVGEDEHPNLEPILIYPNDLPPHFTDGPISKTSPVGDMANAYYVVHQAFMHDGKEVGGITIWEFSSDQHIADAFATLTHHLPDTLTARVGERRAASLNGPLRMAFTRCTGLAYIEFDEGTPTNMIE